MAVPRGVRRGDPADPLLGSAQALPSAPYRKLDIFTRVLSYVEENYVDPITEDDIIYGAIDGMMESLDPHSVFLHPKIYAEMKHDNQGEFGGIGVEITSRKDAVTVVAPIPGTPAERAGIIAGDIILAIDGESTADLSVLEVARQMRGKPGSSIKLTLTRRGKELPAIDVVRARIRIIPVESTLLDEGVAHVRIKAFQKDTVRTLMRELERLEKEAAGPLAGLVIDLRNNPGGLLDQAIAVADVFLDDGVIVSTRGRNRRHAETYNAEAGGRTTVPLVVLVNQGSASASEIVAGALQDHQRAVIIGQQTFGKGSVQTIVDLYDGSGMKLTIARYFTPKGRSIHGSGIRPDIIVEAEKDPPTGPTALSERDPAADPELKTAKDHLKALRIFRKSR